MEARKTVYLVEHVHKHQDGNEDVKTIGIYSSRENAEEAVARLSLQPGFQASVAGFVVDPYTLDQDNWAEGFITIVHTDQTHEVHPSDEPSG